MASDVEFGGLPVCAEDLAQGDACHVAVHDAQIIYNSYRRCFDSVILLPGFGLLPIWFQCGAL